MREFLGNLYKEISIENSQKLLTYRYRRAEDRQSKLVLARAPVRHPCGAEPCVCPRLQCPPRRRSSCALRSPEGVSALAAAGIPIWIDARARVAHEKALRGDDYDGRVTIMGSYNWSKGAASNSEDLNVVTLSEVAEAYAKH